MWTFIPILASKHAWDTRMFNTAYSLKDIVRQLNDKDAEHRETFRGARLVLPGGLYLKPPPLKEGEKEPPAYLLTGKYYRFSGIPDLERILVEEKLEEATIQAITFYRVGTWNPRNP